MNDSRKRKYRSSEYAANIGTSIPVQTFYEIEALAQSVGTTKSEIVRRLIVRGLAEFRANGQLPPSAIPLIEETGQSH